MAVCPRCGTEITKLTKKRFMIGRPTKIGEQFKLTLALFKCPKCEKQFRKVLGKETEKITFKGMVKEIKEIELRLVQTLGDLRKKIEKLKSERAELLEEIEELKKAGEKKASTLEKEVASLREEVESLKEMLGDL